MQMRGSLLLLSAIGALILSGCGSPSHPTSAGHTHKQHAAKKKTVPSKSSTGSTTGGTSTPPSGGSNTGGSQSGSPGQSTSGPSITYAMMPAGTAQGPLANLGVKDLPAGWSLVSMSFVASNGQSVSATIQQAMLGMPPAAEGGFSMGADGQIITFMFPYPAGNWAGRTVHFAFTFKTSSGVPQTLQSASFPFPSE